MLACDVLMMLVCNLKYFGCVVLLVNSCKSLYGYPNIQGSG